MFDNSPKNVVLRVLQRGRRLIGTSFGACYNSYAQNIRNHIHAIILLYKLKAFGYRILAFNMPNTIAVMDSGKIFQLDGATYDTKLYLNFV